MVESCALCVPNVFVIGVINPQEMKNTDNDAVIAMSVDFSMVVGDR